MTAETVKWTKVFVRPYGYFVPFKSDFVLNHL